MNYRSLIFRGMWLTSSTSTDGCWAAPVPTVLQSPHPTPETRREWNHPRSRPHQHTHHTLNNSFP